MVLKVVYNERDSFAAEWLRRLCAQGSIEPGEVHEDDVRELNPEKVRGADQFHAFAGIGVWSYALRLAGWPAAVPVWTGSCPCQPFSQAGRGRGAADDRHLWPAWRALIDICRPSVIFGEQVASPLGRSWLGSVQADLEALGYLFVAADLCAAGVGAPHQRQRLFFAGIRLEDADRQRRAGLGLQLQPEAARQTVLEAPGRGQARGVEYPADERLEDGVRGNNSEEGGGHRIERSGHARGLGYTYSERARRDRRPEPGPQGESRGAGVESLGDGDPDWFSGRAGGLADSVSTGRPAWRPGAGLRSSTWCGPSRGLADPDREGREHGPESFGRRLTSPPGDGYTRGVWSDADWLLCRDGKARPVEPGTFPLAHGAAGRVAVRLPGGETKEINRRGALRGLGNAIVPQVAAAFIQAVMEII